MSYDSTHTGPEIDAAVQMLSQVHAAREATKGDLAEVKLLAEKVDTSTNQVQSQASTVVTKAEQVSAHAQVAEQARMQAVSASTTAQEAKSVATEAAGAAATSRQAANASQQAAAKSEVAAGLSEQVTAESAASAENSLSQVRVLAQKLGGGSIESFSLPGVAFAIQDSSGSTPFFIKADGVTRTSALDSDAISLGGVDLNEKLNTSSVAKASDLIMSDKGLIPIYPVMSKISGWGSSSLDYLGFKLQAMLKGVAPQASYFNGAKAGETSRDTSGRLGSVPMLISVPSGSLPAEAGQVVVTCSNVARSMTLRPFTGTLAGVYGTMSSDGKNFYFNRKEAGSAVAVSPGTPFLPDLGPTYRDGVALFWMGKNDISGTDTVAEIAKRTDVSFDYFTPYVKRILVFGHFANPSWKGGPLVDRVLQVNALHAARYSSYYVDTLGYLESSQVWADTGITPTADDLSAQQGHCLAPSLTDDGVHFNEKLNVAFTEFVKQKIKKLGWF